MILGKRKRGVVRKPKFVEQQEKLPTPRPAHTNFEGSSSCLTMSGANKHNNEAQSYTLYSECTKLTSVTASCEKRRRPDDFIAREQ